MMQTREAIIEITQKITTSKGGNLFNRELAHSRQETILKQLEWGVVEFETDKKILKMISTGIYFIIRFSSSEDIQIKAISLFKLLFETESVLNEKELTEHCVSLLMNISIQQSLEHKQNETNQVWMSILSSKNSTLKTFGTLYFLDNKSNSHFSILSKNNQLNNQKLVTIYKTAWHLVQQSRGQYPRINRKLGEFSRDEIQRRIFNQFWYGQYGLEGLPQTAPLISLTIPITVASLSQIEKSESSSLQLLMQSSIKFINKTIDETIKHLKRAYEKNESPTQLIDLADVLVKNTSHHESEKWYQKIQDHIEKLKEKVNE